MEAEWEEDRYTEDKVEVKETLGVSHQITDNSRVGLELLHELEYDDWSEWKDHVVYFGPNISFEINHIEFALTPAVQITDVDAEADFLTRLIVGIEF